MELGELVSLYRKQANMTIDDLAEKSGVPKGTINKIIGGITKAPTLDTVKALAKALGLSINDFDDDPANIEDDFMWLEKLRYMKDASGLTTREIAAQSGIPEPTLEKLFAGATKDPKLTTIQQVVHFLGYTLDDLDDFKAKKSPAPAEASTGEISIEESNNLLVALGYIKPGEQISDDDLAFLGNVIGLLDAWFDKH